MLGACALKWGQLDNVTTLDELEVGTNGAEQGGGGGKGKGKGDDDNEVRSIHWFPYDPVRVVNADP